LKIEGWLGRWLIAFGFWLLQIWARYAAYEVDDRAGVAANRVTKIISALSGTIACYLSVSFAVVFAKIAMARALISASRDGDLLADATIVLAYDVVRGSSSATWSERGFFS